ncbi:MAG: hypothetical protein IPP47_26530 [Bryobacterales bacterium]|nr:hypothetical protein [Bryobacterales bacterium]
MTPEAIRLHAKERKRLSGCYRQLFDEISAILFRHDPIGINFEDNTDEYDQEAGTILSRVRSASTVEESTSIVHEEFIRWFDGVNVGPREKYSPIAIEILCACQRANLR